MKKLVLFDFDGTITTTDTFVAFIRYNKGFLRFATGFLLLSPFIVAFKLKLYPNWKAKEVVLAYFFKGTSLTEFEKMCYAFYQNKLPSLIRPKALEEIANHKADGYEICIVSASPELWIKDWAKEQRINLIGTQLEVVNHKITGKITGKNCYGFEKECRVKSVYNLSNYHTIEAYGDSSGDKELLALAHLKHYKPFRN